MAMTAKQIDDAIRLKAERGKGVTDSANQAAYDKYRAQYEAEVARKQADGTPLAGNSKGTVSAANQSLYDSLAAAQNQPQERISAGGPTGEVTTSNVNTGTTNMGGGGSSAQSLIDELAAYQKQQAIAGLGKARDNALSNLNSERSTIAPKYYDQRNQAAAGSQQQARNFAEFMASRGGTNSGANAQGELTRGMTLQGNLGTLGRQEAQAYTDIERRMSDVNNAYESDVASASAGADSMRLQALLNDFYQQQQRELDIAGLTGMLGGQRTLGGQGLDLQRQGQEWNQNYQVGRDAVTDSQWAQTFAEDKRRYGEEFAYQKARDSITDNQWKQSFDEDNRRYGLDYALQQQQMRQSAANSSASNSLSRERFEYEKSQDKVRQDEALKESSSEKMSQEKQGLATAFRNGQITPEQARRQIQEDVQLGFYTEAEAKEMNDALNILTGTTQRTSDPLNFVLSGGFMNPENRR